MPVQQQGLSSELVCSNHKETTSGGRILFAWLTVMMAILVPRSMTLKTVVRMQGSDGPGGG
jgi:hypothetical protein